MKFFYTTTSPYARKCHMALHIRGLIPHCERTLADQFDESFRRINPLGKVPAIEDGDLVLFDSPLICEYLDKKASEIGEHPSRLLRHDSPDYFRHQQLHVLADGIIDAAVAIVYEKRRETEPSQYWIERWQQAIQASVKSINLLHAGSPEIPHIGTVALVTALAYLDFRLDHLNWRQLNSALADWYAPFTQQPWFTDTAPQA